MTNGTRGPKTGSPEIAEMPCAYCGGSGHDLVTGSACQVCRGEKTNAVMKPEKPCPHCKGSGKAFMKVGVPCPSCGGSGYFNYIPRT